MSTIKAMFNEDPSWPWLSPDLQLPWNIKIIITIAKKTAPDVKADQGDRNA
jgi:hypothetical protein